MLNPVNIMRLADQAVAIFLTRLEEDHILINQSEAFKIFGDVDCLCLSIDSTYYSTYLIARMFNTEEIIIPSHGEKKRNALISYVGSNSVKEVLLQSIACTIPYSAKSFNDLEESQVQFLEAFGVDLKSMREQYDPEINKTLSTASINAVTLKNVNNGTATRRKIHIKGPPEEVITCCVHFHDWKLDQVVPFTAELKAQALEYVESKQNQNMTSTHTFCRSRTEGHEIGWFSLF
eukprot:TRINITY_DN1635_c0_g1_i13.p2 TRINITY_DN1635_c0_g1~~TRINITY_DN1635_c0_g1_i13.p2  ORF type:complete len:234 (-),score=6.34 TRINITY_DN1635_c0_g1_i13:909-1610(-)